MREQAVPRVLSCGLRRGKAPIAMVANTPLIPKLEMARVSKRMAAMAAVALVGAVALIAIMMTTPYSSAAVELKSKAGLGLKTSDLALLQHAIHAQNQEKHRACVTECATDDCKKACGKIHSNPALKKAMASSFKKINIHHKKKLGLKTKDEDLLKDAIKGQQKEEVAHCHSCVTAECKLNCKSVLAAHAKKAAPVAAKKTSKKLGLKTSDLTLLQDAQKRQAKEQAKGMFMHKMDQQALKHKGSSSLKVDTLNHQPADDGDGDWSPGMRKDALSQLKDEEEQAKQTAKEAEANDADDSWTH